LLVTSPSRGDGKTTTAANLALLLATEIDRRVLLVDGDLRKPAVGTLFGARPAPGLSDVALGRAEWRDIVRSAPWNGLAVLPSGSLIARPTEALNGSRTRTFFDQVKSDYDYVVVDAPPVLPIADAMVLAGLVDAVLLVVRAGKTNRDSVLEAVDALGKANLIGVALNAVPAQPFGGSRYYAY
jgi:capsular exopolysaccharide synthesis family protein